MLQTFERKCIHISQSSSQMSIPLAKTTLESHVLTFSRRLRLIRDSLSISIQFCRPRRRKRNYKQTRFYIEFAVYRLGASESVESKNMRERERERERGKRRKKAKDMERRRKKEVSKTSPRRALETGRMTWPRASRQCRERDRNGESRCCGGTGRDRGRTLHAWVAGCDSRSL